ncbi:MAG: helix-turn-helix transcriptional regulator [Clostridia bacterium]|nr:helix-turn-helix transcriptional regulator [Clostridia bacterium]
MNQPIPIITKVEFFDTSYEPMKANVSARNFSSLTYRQSGRVFLASKAGELISEADTLTFMPSGFDYSTEILEGGKMIILHYQIAEGCKDFFDQPTLIRPINKDRFSDIFLKALSHSMVGNECACMSDAYRLFSEIFKENNLSGDKPSPRLAMIKQYMDQHFTSPELRISDLAKLHKTSEAYFRRTFKQYYGESPLEYIKRRRIELACRLLCTELYSITDVAVRAGFDNASYFSSEFKRMIGCSPKEYRDM